MNKHVLLRIFTVLLFSITITPAFSKEFDSGENFERLKRTTEARQQALKDWCIGGYFSAWTGAMFDIEKNDHSKPADSYYVQMLMKIDGSRYSNSAFEKLIDYQILKNGDKITTLPDFDEIDKLVAKRAATDAQADWNNAVIVAESDWSTKFTPPNTSRAEKACKELIK